MMALTMMGGKAIIIRQRSAPIILLFDGVYVLRLNGEGLFVLGDST